MRVEPATLEDVEAVLDLWVRLAEEQREYGSHVDPDANRESLHDRFAHDAVAGDLLVAREDGQLLGFVAFTVADPALDRGHRRGVVRYCYVVPDRRGEGIGTALFDAAESALADRGCDRVALELLAANEAAMRLYRRRGYETHRIEVEKPLDPDDSADDERERSD